MISQKRNIFPLLAKLSAAAFLACAPLLAGCKGNTTSAAYPDHAIPAPPSVTAFATPADPLAADPLSNPLWTEAHWMNFQAPANTARTTAPTQAAMLFDPNLLYVAFISEHQPSAKVVRDEVSLYLDTTPAGDGTEMLHVTVDINGDAGCTWIRSATPANRRDDGAPDFAHPVSTIPDVRIPGLATHVNPGNHDGKSVWTAVVAIPLRNLPLSLRTSPSPGSHWKINLLRTVTIGKHNEQLQSNLSPVYVGAQEFAPFRMADLTLAQ